jgi:hypothetical protein
MKARDAKPTKFILPPQISQKDIAGLKKQYGFTEISQLGFGLTYKAKWDTWSAIREFVQNAFDVIAENHKDRKALGNVLLEYDARQKIGYIADDEGGIKYKNMFLAESKEESSIGVECLRGKFGEGMKFALIPLLRDGHSVMIRTVGFDYHFCSVLMGQGDFDLIHLFQLPNKVTVGTCIAIHGVDPTEYRDRFIPLRLAAYPEDLLLEAKTGCKVRQALKSDKSGVGKFYIRDIYICEIDSLYDYNFWFKDPTRVLDPDRSSIRLETRLDSFLREFIFLLEMLTPVFGSSSSDNNFWGQFFARLLHHKHPKRLFEYTVLDFSSEKNCEVRSIPRPLDADLFRLLTGILNTETFGWSQDYRGGKEMEHHGVIDLQNKLPDLSYWLDEFVLTPDKIKALRRQQSADQIVITPEDFIPLGQKAVTAIQQLYARLSFLADSICDRVSGELSSVPVYLYVGANQDERIREAGHTDYEVINLNWVIIEKGLRQLPMRTEKSRLLRAIKKEQRARKIRRSVRRMPKNQIRAIAQDVTTELVKTLMHELTHYCCAREGFSHDCGDLTESFENTMEDVMMSFARVTQELVLGDLETPAQETSTSIEMLLEAVYEDYSGLLQVETAWKDAADRAQRMKIVDTLIEGFDERSKDVSKQEIKKNRQHLIQRALRNYPTEK